MKIVISRKGFDGAHGGIASPIITLANGAQAMYSLPIPSQRSTCGYEDITWNGTSLQSIIRSLRPRLQMPNTPHLDPDLVAGAVAGRLPGWRAVFGQSGAQETQLRNQHVDNVHSETPLGERPLFLFFGWYRQIEAAPEAAINGDYRYVRGSPDIHAFFGWLQVDEKISFNGQSRELFRRQYAWAANHPHVACEYYDKGPNALYIAPDPADQVRNKLVIGDTVTELPAAGMFERFDPELHTLTWPGPCPIDNQENNRRSHWKLPLWFYRNGTPTLQMNKNPNRWTPMNENYVHLASANIGQEFIFDTADYDLNEVGPWIARLVRAGQKVAKSKAASPKSS